MSRPAVVFGGPSDEHDISILTGLQVVRALGEADAFYWSKTRRWYRVDPSLEAADFVEGVPRRSTEIRLEPVPGRGFVDRKPLAVSVVVNCCHGGPGEDGTLQGLLDLSALAYTGPGQAASALGMDKFAFSTTMAAAGLHGLPRSLLIGGEEDPPPFNGPYILKPRFGGSSIGIEVVEDWETALRLHRSSPFFADGVVVEPFLADSRDLQIAVRTYPQLELSAIEAPVRSGSGIYNYQQKYLAWGGEVSGGRQLPAIIDEKIEDEVRSSAARVARLAGLRGVCRIDFLEHDGEIWLNEVNTIPGSMAAYLWMQPPIDRRDLLMAMIEEAEITPGRRMSSAASDGTALRNAGSIESKLG
jgi:D-alanine-D-alanine ligase